MNEENKGFSVFETIKITKVCKDIETSDLSVILELNNGKELKLSYDQFISRVGMSLLASKGFEVHKDFHKDLKAQLQQGIENKSIETVLTVPHIGHLSGKYIHPADRKYVVEPKEEQEKEYAQAYQCAGSLDGWKEQVLNPHLDIPEAVFMIVASFASVTLTHLKIQPFIVELHGLTSTGKSTILQVSRSVWGEESLIKEWQTTLRALELNAAYAGIFPVFMDDTKKAPSGLISKLVYHFSGGQTKGRGSFDAVRTSRKWKNILLSTGEFSIKAFDERSGGIAGRCISLELPDVKHTLEHYNKVYQGMENNYGVVGYEFLKKWQELVEVNGNNLLMRYEEINKVLNEKAHNAVLQRIARYYAAIILVAQILNENFDMQINIDELYNLFVKLNKADEVSTDTVKYKLLNLLDLIDEERAFNKSYYKSIEGDLILPVYYINNYLDKEKNIVRKSWNVRGFTEQYIDTNGNTVDYVKKSTLDYNNKTAKRNVIVIKNETLLKLGYDFN